MCVMCQRKCIYETMKHNHFFLFLFIELYIYIFYKLFLSIL